MPLDPVIAGGFRGVQLENPLDAYARVAQLQQAQQQNQLARMQMDRAQRESEIENRLAQIYQRPGADPTSPEFVREVYAVSPARGAAFQKSAQEALKAQRDAEAAAERLASDRIANARSLLPSITPETWGAWRADTIRKLPGLANVIPEVYSEEARERLMQTADQYLASRKPMQVSAGASVYLPGATTPMFTAPAKAAPSEVARLSSELAEAQAAGNTALASSLQARIQRLTEKPVGAQTVIKLPEQERAEKGARGKLLVEQYQDVSKAASLAAKTLPAVETQERVLDSGFKTGFGTEVQKAGASVLAALGVPEAAKYATSAQTFLAATQQAVLQRQLEQKGPQTEADAQRITQTGAQLGNTPEANRFIISVAKAQLKRDIAQRNFYDKWWKDKGTYDGAEDAWFSGDGGKSLFDRPELKQYATKPAAPAGGGWRVVR